MWQTVSLFAQQGGDGFLDSPIVIGLFMFLIGSILIAYGAWGMKSGTTRGKWGFQYEGGMAYFISLVRILGGLVCFGFGIYQLFAG